MGLKATLNTKPNPRIGAVRNYGGKIVGVASIDPRTGNRVTRLLGKNRKG